MDEGYKQGMTRVAETYDRTPADQYFLHGMQYQLAANKLSGESARKRTLMGEWYTVIDVVVYLYCHSMELFLKAYLTDKNVCFGKNDTHNLENLACKCLAEGLTIPPTISDIISIMAPFNRSKDKFPARFSKPDAYDVPHAYDMAMATQRLREIVTELRHALKK